MRIKLRAVKDRARFLRWYAPDQKLCFNSYDLFSQRSRDFVGMEWVGTSQDGRSTVMALDWT